MIDFKNAFDSVSWQFIHKALFFNFGPSIRRWISVYQYETVSAITQSGFLSFFVNKVVIAGRLTLSHHT